MASPQANTKIERAVEAVEGLTVAVVAAQATTLSAPDVGEHKRRPPNYSALARFHNVRDARQELRDAFAEFLSPVLRVVTPDGQ